MAPKLNTFEVLKRSALGRIGRFRTAHGNIETPTILPVINPNLIGEPGNLSPQEIKKEFRADAVITNSYIIWQSDELKEKALSDGVQKLIGFDGAVMTDSGTFQMYMYGDVQVEPLEIVKFQRDIGSDIGTILDLFTKPDEDREKAESDIEGTFERGQGSVGVKGDMALAGTIQGGVYPDLRSLAAKRMSSLDFDVHPIGGVVPIMESYRYKKLTEVILAAKRELNPARPVHLFGAGHPMVIPLAVALGCDLFDSASYAKFAAQGRMMFADSTRFLKDLDDLPCSCPVCSGHTIQELKSLDKATQTKMLARHNLHVTFKALRQARQAIYEGTIWELAERSLHDHPRLNRALESIYTEPELQERREPTAGRRFFYTCPTSMQRPLVRRFKQRFIERYRPRTKYLLIGFMGNLEARKPYGTAFADDIRKLRAVSDADIMFMSYYGPVPLELDEVYPIAQSLVPDVHQLPKDVQEKLKDEFEKFSHDNEYQMAVMYDGDTTILDVENWYDDVPMRTHVFDRVLAVSDFQFGNAATDAMFPKKDDMNWVTNEVKIKTSRKTGKIRNVIVEGEHILSMRAHDGLFTLKQDGAKRILAGTKAPTNRLVVNDDSVPFNKEGKSVFAPFVISADPDLRPMDECIIVDGNDEFVAVGRMRLAPDEIEFFKTGIAAEVRSGSDDED